MGLYQRLLHTVSRPALLGKDSVGGDSVTDYDNVSQKRTGRRLRKHDSQPRSGQPPSGRRDRLLRTPLVFETLEPRVLLSGDPITLAMQNALVSGLQSFESWTANNLIQTAQLAQQLPVVSTSVGDLVDLPAQIQTHLVQPAQAYFAAAGSTSTFEGLAAALRADPAEAGTVLGQFADGEYLFALSNFQTSTPINPVLNLASDSAGTGLQFSAPPTLSGNATVSMALSFGFDTGTSTGATPGFFIRPATITEGVTLAAPSFNATATLGAADATVTGGAASLNATATVQIKDPIFGDTANYITPSELASAESATGVPLASLVSASLSGSASLTLPISSSLVAGGPQSLQLAWSNLTAGGSSNLSSLGAWAQLDTISPALVQQAVAALPGIIQAAAGSEGFGATLPVLGSSLGQLFDFGAQFNNAAAAVAGATSLSQVASALQANLGGTVSFTVNTADNELDMLVTVSNAFDTTVPYAINTQVDGNTLMVSGNLSATGTATATLNLGLSFDAALPDASRMVLIANGSSLSLAFDAVTATPIVTAALGLIRASVGNGSIAVGAQSGSGADPAQPATATITFGNGNSSSASGGRVTLAQLASNFTATIGAPVFTGAIQATLPLVGVNGASSANLGITWLLDQPAGTAPQMTGAAQAASLAVTLSSLTSDPTLTAQAVAGLQTLVPWAVAATTAADQTGGLATQLPLANQTLASLSGLAPATGSGTYPGALTVIASAINSYAVTGASTANFQSAINTALAAFTAANPAYTFSVSASAGEIPASDTTDAAALGLTPGVDQLVFTLNVTETYKSTPTLSLSPSAADDDIGFSAPGTATGTVNLALTFAVEVTPNVSAQDGTYVILNGLTAGATAVVSGPFPIGIGLLGATVSAGSVGLTTSVDVAMAADGTGTPQAYPIGAILGTAAANLLNVTEQQPSTVTGQLTLTATPTTTFGTLDNGTTTIMISGDPLSGTAPTVVFSGTEATQYQSFANMAPSDLLGALSTLGSAMDDVGEFEPVERRCAADRHARRRGRRFRHHLRYGHCQRPDQQLEHPGFRQYPDVRDGPCRASRGHRRHGCLQQRQQPVRHRLHPVRRLPGAAGVVRL